jgi:hypothetical protein
VGATSRAWYDELRLPGVLAAGLREAGLDEGGAWATADLVRVLLALPRPSALRRPARTVEARLLDQWLARDVVRTAIGVNTWQGVEYLDRDAFARMLAWAMRLDAIDADAGIPAEPAPAGAREKVGAVSGEPDLAGRLTTAAEAAGYRIDRLRDALASPPSPPPRRRAPRSGPKA